MEDGRPQPVSPAARATPADLARLSALLDEALELPAAGRAAWLEKLRAESAPLATTLAGLLARASGSETVDLLDRGPGLVSPDAPPDFAAGDRVGPYRLLRQIGLGGMGEVWLAERADGQLKRQVALKLPMLGLRRSVLVQRFERERDILASLEHPHIARLYDAGLAADGQPYLALEHVEGTPIGQYCDEQRLDTRARVELLRQVMQAVQYAHANLVIHRDLKPSNVLVTAQGQARLLDFGIAKLLQEEQVPVDETELTRVGGRALTLQYAAPEQVSGGAISIATDVWALGVLLYELLTGRLPFAAGDRNALERAVLEEDPARPSNLRNGVIKDLPRSLATDLDTIVLKALKKSPADRYTTVDAFAEDLERWLRGEPVLALPDRLAYRLRRFVGRHRLPVAAAGIAVVALAAVSGIAFWQAAEARRQAALALQEATRAKVVQRFVTELFEVNSTAQDDPQVAQRTTARELLDRGAARVDEALRDAPQARLEVAGVLANLYAQIGLEQQAAQMQRQRVSIARVLYGAYDHRLADVLLSYVDVLQEGDERAAIPALLDEALAILDAAGEGDTERRANALVARARYWRYESLRRALVSANDAVLALARLDSRQPALVLAHLLVARARMSADDLEGAEGALARSTQVAVGLGAMASAMLINPYKMTADLRIRQMRYAESEAWLRAALALSTTVYGADHPETLQSQARLGNLLYVIGRSAEAEAMHDAAQRGLLLPNARMDSWRRADLEGLLGQSLMGRGRPDLLMPILRADLDELVRTLPRSPMRARRELVWAEVQTAMGHIDEARTALALARRQWRIFADGADTPVTDFDFALAEARLALAEGQPATATEKLDLGRPALPRQALERNVLRAHALRSSGRAVDAVRAAESAVEEIGHLAEGRRPIALWADALEALGLAKLALGDRDGARDHLRQALTLRRWNDAEGSLALARLEHELAQLPGS